MADGLAERTRPRTTAAQGSVNDSDSADVAGEAVGADAASAVRRGLAGRLIGAMGGMVSAVMGMAARLRGGGKGGDDEEGDDQREAGSAEGEPATAVAWSDLWQVPTILASVMLIAAGLVVAMQRGPQDDFGGALAEVERLIESRELERAGRGLAEMLEPNLDIATVPQRARFHACVADWMALAQEAEGVNREENNLRVHEQYSRAVDLGHELNAERTERWGHALISLDMLEDARHRIAELVVMDRRDPEAGIRARQGRLFRRVIERKLGRPKFDDALLMELLAEYRADRRATLEEQVWAMARQAEVRIETGRVQEAIDRLFIDMRRIEHDAGTERPGVAELYALVGKGYFLLGRFDQASANLARVVDDAGAKAGALALAHDLLGRIAASEANLEKAFEHFDLVVRDFVNAPNHLTAILGRAEAYSALGNHEAGRMDYVRLVQLLSMPADRRNISPVRVASSLIDRHDSSLARGDLKTAISYVKIAESLFDGSSVPVEVLLRVATTSRQIADDVLVEAEAAAPSFDKEEAVRLRHEANVHYRQAGEYFVRHARGLVALPGRDGDWATSLWNGADSFDLGGFHELAVVHFEEYLAGRSVNDPRRSDVMFRLAQCHHALMQYEKAASYYEQVIVGHPRSPVATRSHVPLARCYVALERRPEAEQQLGQVLAGLLPIQPSAADYRDALLELANIYYQARNHAAAIARFYEAVERYPDDPRRLETKFRLADSHRSLALELAGRLRPPSSDSPGERRRMEEYRREHLLNARKLFAAVSAGYDGRDPARMEPHERDIHRLADLYRADCAFFLGEYESAIALYDQAARRYANHHSSLHALVQIVNAYSSLGDQERAEVAHRRALVRLGQLRVDAFDAPDALMDREAWERWLANAPVAARQASAVNTQ